MTRYQLAKLVLWAGTLNTRKRLQKVAFMLQAAGCPLEAGFILHYYGPYSEDVARLTDEMVRLKLLEEIPSPVSNGTQFSYRLPEEIARQLRELEASDRGAVWEAQLAPFEDKAKVLLQTDLKELEYASTILYFRCQGKDWDTAVEKACQFKNTPAVRSALGLAQQALA
jgi:uncharacterized protein YwgA